MYYVRLFTPDLLSTLIPLQAQLLQMGYQVTPEGTNQLNIFYDGAHKPFTADLADSTNPTTQQEIAYFLDAVAALPHDSAQDQVLGVLARTRVLLVIGVPDDYNYDEPALYDVMDIVANSADGLIQIDGDGFYKGNQLVLALKTT